MTQDKIEYILPATWALAKIGTLVESEKGKKPKNQSKVRTVAHDIPYVDIRAF